MAARKGLKAHLLKYTTSGELTGDYSHSVSYASICFTGEDVEPSGDGSADLTPAEQETLLGLARHTLKTFLATGGPPEDLEGFGVYGTVTSIQQQKTQAAG